MKFPLTLFIAAMLVAPVPMTALAVEHATHDTSAPHQLELNAGKKWATDIPLRKGMSTIRSSVATTLAAVHAGKATTAEYDALAKTVNAQVAYMVENCKLDPRADAQLHFVIADIMQGNEIVEGKQSGQDRASGAVQIAHALNAYGEYFDHADWREIKLGR